MASSLSLTVSCNIRLKKNMRIFVGLDLFCYNYPGNKDVRGLRILVLT